MRFSHHAGSKPDAERTSLYRRLGYHTGESLGSLVERAATARPNAVAIVDDRSITTYREFEAKVTGLGRSLLDAGIRAGDVIAIQCPNRAEVNTACLAGWRIGAVVCPIVDIYRESELRQILPEVRPAAVFTVGEHRGCAHAEMFDDVLADLGIEPRIRVIVGTERSGWRSFDLMLEAPPIETSVTVELDEPALVLLTSGTTARSKAVVHSHRTLVAETRQFVRALGWTFLDPSHVPVPTAHVAGLLRGLLAPVYVGAPTILRERWRADQVIEDLIEHDIRFPVAPASLMGEFLDAYAAAGAPEHRVRILVGGTSRADRERAEDSRFVTGRPYGMSELPTVSLPDSTDPLERRLGATGRLAPGVEGRIVPLDGSTEHGELVVRGPEQMLGYLDAADQNAVWTDDGFIRTGDIARFDADGYLEIVGRVKDIISRGGEKISALELEQNLADHTGVKEIAVVAGNDPRLGEVPVAFVVPSSVGRPTGSQLAEFLRALGLARQKIPERWHFVDGLPKTASGKVRKVELVRADSERVREPEKRRGSAES